MSTSIVNAFINESGAEILKSFRTPEFIIPTIILPVAFYTFFAIAIPGGGQNASYLLATYGVFAVMGPSLFGFGVGVANERDRGWLKLKRAVPSSAFAYIGAKFVATLVFAALSLALVYAVAGFVGGVSFPRGTWATLLGVHLMAVAPFILVGLTLGFTFNASGAVAITNIVFLGFAALGGLWLPVFLFPAFLQAVSNYMPSFHLGEIALAVINAPGTHDPYKSLFVVSVMTLVFAFLATIAWMRQR